MKWPSIFLPHGGGPWPFIDESTFGTKGMWDQMAGYMRGLYGELPAPPKAVVVISAHWEEARPTVMTHARPPMYYDYYNFPKEAYEVEWPAPGTPELALELRDALESAGFSTGTNEERGYDHGVFVPLKLADPGAAIPTTQLSLVRGLDPLKHYRVGQALAPFRDRGVLFIGSGMSYHNLREFMATMRGRSSGNSVAEDSRRFDDWLVEAMARDASAREQALVEWEKAPRARACHPREEHLLPLMVIAGTADEPSATTPYRDRVMGAQVTAVHFG